MKRIFPIICLLFSFFVSFAQVRECGTVDNSTRADLEALNYYGNNKVLLEVLKNHDYDIPNDYFELEDEEQRVVAKKVEEAWSERNNSTNSTTVNRYYVPLKIWVHANNNGVRALSENDVKDRVKWLNYYFATNNIPISFYIKCTIEVKYGNEYYDIDNDTELDYIWSHDIDPNAINVHFVHNATWNGVARLSGQFIAISCANAIGNNSSTLAHEMGHALGLYHTHQGRGEDDNANNNACLQECVSRTRQPAGSCLSFTIDTPLCAINGDLLCDTPAEPMLSSFAMSRDCIISYGTSKDKWDERWQSLGDNIMSYAGQRLYRHKFSLGQKAIMLQQCAGRGYITSNTPSSYAIDGSSILCINKTADYTVVGTTNTGFTWETASQTTDPLSPLFVPNGFAITALPNNQTARLTAPATFNSATWLFATPNDPCNNLYLFMRVRTNGDRLSIVGPTTVSIGSTVTYQALNTFLPYWTVPQYWTILSGQGSAYLTVRIEANASCADLYLIDRNTAVCENRTQKAIKVEGVTCGNPCGYASSPTDPITTLVADSQRKTLQATTDSEKLLTLAIIGLVDAKVYKTITIAKGSESIDLSDLPPGTYMAAAPGIGGPVGPVNPCSLVYRFILL